MLLADTDLTLARISRLAPAELVALQLLALRDLERLPRCRWHVGWGGRYNGEHAAIEGGTMDTSEAYIKMCEKAVEIQLAWKPQGGDWYIHDYRGCTKTSPAFEQQIWGNDNKTWQRVEILCYRPSESKDVAVSTDGEASMCIAVADLVRKHSTWLCRQDQLQEMVFGAEPIRAPVPAAMLKLLYDNIHFIKNKDAAYWHSFDSMEQLWLAFVMKEKYGKAWDGSDWVKQ